MFMLVAYLLSCVSPDEKSSPSNGHDTVVCDFNIVSMYITMHLVPRRYFFRISKVFEAFSSRFLEFFMTYFLVDSLFNWGILNKKLYERRHEVLST